MDWKALCKKLLFPPLWVMILLTVACTASLIVVFVKGWEESIPAYILYALSFYTMSVICLFCWLTLPAQYRKIREKIHRHPLGHRYMTDRVFRGKVSLYCSLAINLLFAGVDLWTWHFSRSWWYVVLAMYYSILSVMRFLLVRYVRVNQIGASMAGEWKRSRICGGILLLVNLSLSGAVLMMLNYGRGYDYPGMLIYVMAAYTFYSTTHAIISMVKYRHLGSPVMSTAKIISLSAALVSMLNLETAMFTQFGEEMALRDQQIMIAATGAGISITVVALSVLLIHRATKELKIL